MHVLFKLEVICSWKMFKIHLCSKTSLVWVKLTVVSIGFFWFGFMLFSYNGVYFWPNYPFRLVSRVCGDLLAKSCCNLPVTSWLSPWHPSSVGSLPCWLCAVLIWVSFWLGWFSTQFWATFGRRFGQLFGADLGNFLAQFDLDSILGYRLRFCSSWVF